MIEEKLEILLITYNRSKDLENTFEQLLESPFAKCKLTILDNCSDDDTPIVCEKYYELFHNLKIIRHARNIGAVSNYLRAVEISKYKYSWILCDDDNYDFSDCDDIIEAIMTGKFDLISVGHPNYSNWIRGVETTVKKLIESGSTFFITQSFLPSTIYKSELFDSNCIYYGYLNTCNFFPTFAFINKAIEKNFSVYVSKKTIVSRSKNDIGFSIMEWYSGWFNSCLLIENKDSRIKAARELPVKGNKFIFSMIYSEKILNKKRFPNIYLSFFSGFLLIFWGSREFFSCFLIIFAILIPSTSYKYFKKIYNNF